MRCCRFGSASNKLMRTSNIHATQKVVCYRGKSITTTTTTSSSSAKASANATSKPAMFYEIMTKRRKLILTDKFQIDISYSELAGHSSFLLLAKSYLEHDPLVLRSLAMTGFGCMSLFQYYRPKPLWLPLRWNAVFITINLGMIAILLDERFQSREFPEEEEELYQSLFFPSGISRPDFLHLMEICRKRRADECGCLAKQGAPQTKLCLVLDGKAKVYRDGQVIAVLRKNQFFGEMSFINFREAHLARALAERVGRDDELKEIKKANATADITADDDAEIMIWDFDELNDLLTERRTLRNTFIACIASDLVKKLVEKEAERSASASTDNEEGST